MKKQLLTILSAIFMLFGFISLSAQVTCESPNVIINDDIEAYTTGDATGQASHWISWPGATIGGEVSEDFAESGTKSIKIDGNTSGQDALLFVGDQTTGHFIIKWDMYIPDSKLAYFNLQHEAPTSTAGFWGFDAFFELDGMGRLSLFAAEDIP
ncbi:MAG: hypothetical protein HKN16_03540, partial [Saprospiraceae bacterium]|nr:hypothetical protein [Saprospiraceae bacterium]